MRKSVKVCLIIAVLLIVTGVSLFIGAMSASEWDTDMLSTTKYIDSTYEIGEHFSNIAIISNTADIELHLAEDGKCSVVCHEQENLRHTVQVQEGALMIDVVDERAWYEHIGIDFGTPKITICLPEELYGALFVVNSTGSIRIDSGLTFHQMNLHTTTGSIASEADVLRDVRMEASTGNISITDVTAELMELRVSTGAVMASGITCSGNLAIHVSTGWTNLEDAYCGSISSEGNTGDFVCRNVTVADTLSVERSTGDVRLENCDAGELCITTSTGDVTGSLLSGKVFVCVSDTGRVDVPDTTAGGKCEIRTGTGDIRIEVK